MNTVSITMTSKLDDLLTLSATHHHKICPRQVLGVRIGLLAGRLLEIPLPQPEKRLLATAETDGCFVDGVSAATGCYVGRAHPAHRRLRQDRRHVRGYAHRAVCPYCTAQQRKRTGMAIRTIRPQ